MRLDVPGRRSRGATARPALAGVLAAVLVLTTGLLTAPALGGGPGADPTVHERRVIGHSVRGRPIVAYRLGDAGATRVVLIASMHGDEPASRKILLALRSGPAVHGIDLWVLPTYNPDGLAAQRRQNAHGVDLTRNFPYHWVDLDGATESGPRPASEPETRAVMAFLGEIRPARVVSFHQPLYGVDTDTKDPTFARRLAAALTLPAKSFDCGGVCHGTMTGWFNHRYAGAALTVEYGAHPRRRTLRVTAPRRLVDVLGGYLAAPTRDG
ncbi:MAG: M14 family zinc carboxypeptidase [Nocardioides sp.]